MLSKEELEALKATHKRTVRVADKNGEWEVVYRAPSRTEYKRFRAMLHNDALKADATEWLARACVVYPSPEAFDALLDVYPALGEASSDKIGELAGFTADQMGK